MTIIRQGLAGTTGDAELPLFPARFDVEDWAREHSLSPDYVDCAIAVKLKILDGKCKMPEYEKIIMSFLYDAVKDWPARNMGYEMHELIRYAERAMDTDEPQASDENLKLFIYEKRVLAESKISRPVMKRFKAMLRETGLLPARNEEDDK